MEVTVEEWRCVGGGGGGGEGGRGDELCSVTIQEESIEPLLRFLSPLPPALLWLMLLLLLLLFW